jgi:hypothetical protein
MTKGVSASADRSDVEIGAFLDKLGKSLSKQLERGKGTLELHMEDFRGAVFVLRA